MQDDLITTAAIARELHVSEETIRYHARKGRIPFEITPGKHRRFRIDEVRRALGMAPSSSVPAQSDEEVKTQPPFRINMSEPHREMTEYTRRLLAMTSGYEERTLRYEHEQLDPAAPLAALTVPGTTRYAPSNVVAGVGPAGH